MLRKIITSLLIISFLNIILGCSHTVKVSREEVNLADEKIISVVYPDGKEIKFDDYGAYYIIQEPALSGQTSDGEKIRWPLKHISECRKSALPAVHIADIGSKKITEVVTIKNRVLKFNADGGRYDQVNNMIIGKRDNNAPMRLKLESISEIHVGYPELLEISEITKENSYLIHQVILKKDGLIIELNEKGAEFVEKKAVLSGFTSLYEKVVLDTSEIQYVKVERTDVPMTIAVTLGVVIICVIGLIVAVLIEMGSPRIPHIGM